MDSHALVIWNAGVKIEVGNVDAKVASTNMGIGYGAVDVEFCVWHQDGR